MHMSSNQVNRRRKRLKYALLGALVLLVALAVVFALYRSAHGGAQKGRTGRFGQMTGPQPVQAAAAVKGDIPITLTALGTVTPLATVTVRTQINGHLMQIGFTEGQLVKQGAFLAQVDPRPYEVALEQAEGQFAHDQGLLHQAQADLTRYKALASQDSISAQQLDDQTFLVEQYTGTVKSDQGQVDNAKLNLAYCHITAPVAGRVGLRQVDIGNYVQTSDANGIVVIAEPSPISVIFSLPQDSVPQVLQRYGSGARLPVTLYDRTNTTQIAVGELSAVDNLVNVSTGTVNLRAVFKNADDRLFPNEFVNAVLLVDTLKDTVIVPAAAIQRGAPGTYVYVVGADDTVSLRVVSVGPTDGDRVAILSGLKPGEQVVTDGAEQLKDGAQVTLPAASTAAPAAAATKHSWQKGSGTGHHHRTPSPSGAS
jgi:multidrug efflux system membrane fusion protein